MFIVIINGEIDIVFEYFRKKISDQLDLLLLIIKVYYSIILKSILLYNLKYVKNLFF